MPTNSDKSEATIAERIKKARKDAGLTQLDAAKAIGITPQAISNYERGVNKVPNDTLVDLAELYNVSINYLLGVSEIWTTEILPIFENVAKEHLTLVALLNTDGVPDSVKQTIRETIPNLKTEFSSCMEYISDVKYAALSAYPLWDDESWDFVGLFNALNDTGKELAFKYVEALVESKLYERNLFAQRQTPKTDKSD